MSPSSTPTCSTTRPCCRACWRRPRPRISISSSARATSKAARSANGTRSASASAASRPASRRLVVSAELSDPMSGFFVIRRAAFDRAVRRLSGQGFKILLDLFASSPEPLPLQGAAVPVPPAHPRRKQARYARRVGIPDAAHGQAVRPLRADPLRPVRRGRQLGHRRQSRDAPPLADRRRRSRSRRRLRLSPP